MAGPAPKELQQFCTGCSQYLRFTIENPLGIPNPTGSTRIIPVATGYNNHLVGQGSVSGPAEILGFGQGVLSGITGFYLAQLTLVSQASLTGTCTAVTGSLTFTGSTGSTGLTGWSASLTTGCDGASGCSTNISAIVYFDPNIWQKAPDAKAVVTVEDYYYGNVYAAPIATSGNPVITFNPFAGVVTNCGGAASVNLRYDLYLPGISGSLQNSTWITANCRPCLLA